jgi:Lrp/AsnC family leucine-responsive transcriptional regulator
VAGPGASAERWLTESQSESPTDLILLTICSRCVHRLTLRSKQGIRRDIMSVMDAIDKQIVELLAVDSGQRHEDIAAAVNLSRPAVHARIKRLEACGVIRGYGASVDWQALGRGLTTFLWVRTRGSASLQAATAILGLRNSTIHVEECHRVTGEWCFLLKVRATSTEALQAFIDRVRDEGGVDATMSTIALSTVVEQGKLLKQEANGDA